MTVILRPWGRGNWAPLILTIEGKHATPLFIRIGQPVRLGGMDYRISKVIP